MTSKVRISHLLCAWSQESGEVKMLECSREPLPTSLPGEPGVGSGVKIPGRCPHPLPHILSPQGFLMPPAVPQPQGLQYYLPQPIPWPLEMDSCRTNNQHQPGAGTEGFLGSHVSDWTTEPWEPRTGMLCATPLAVPVNLAPRRLCHWQTCVNSRNPSLQRPPTPLPPVPPPQEGATEPMTGS